VLNRLFKASRNRTLQVSIVSFYMILMGALTVYLLHEYHYGAVLIVVIEIFLATPLVILVERITSSPSGIALLVANDLRVSVVASTLLAGAAVWAYYQRTGDNGPTPHLIPWLATSVLYFGLGAVLGRNLLRLAADLVARALFGRPRFFTTLSLISLWFLIPALIFLPFHPNAMAPSLLGAGFGILLHKGMTLRLNRAVGAYRRLFEVQSQVPATLPLPENEKIALNRLASGRHPITKRFSALRAHLNDCHDQGTMSKRLHLISACAWRLEGRYADAMDDTVVAKDPPLDNLDAQLLLIRALSLEDRDDATDVEIDRILKTLSSTLAGESCPLTLALLARRTAERSIDPSGMLAVSKIPLSFVITSLELRRSTGSVLEQSKAGTPNDAAEFFRGLVAHGVPVTPSWLLDVCGYSLLVAGCPDEARVFLQRCISLDPDYSYGYLHLGDYFLFRNAGIAARGPLANTRKADSWHAQACYLLAQRIERNKSSRVGRLARSRLDLIDTLHQDQLE
jgi:hypothetical protein